MSGRRPRGAWAARLALGAAALAILAGPASPPSAAAEECGLRLSPESAAALDAQDRAGAYKVPEQWRNRLSPQYLLNVPITAHIVRRSNGTGGLADTSVDSSLAAANQYYVGAGIRFSRSGAIRYIDNDSLYLGINTQGEIDALRQTDVVANTVNIYFTLILGYTDANGKVQGLCGQSSFTTDPIQGITFADSCTTFQGNLSTVAHELGHYFDLYHTHETSFGVECPSENNCSTAGDKLCDTPADPTLSATVVDSSCQYTGGATACGGQAYAPDAQNLMSYAEPKNCRTRFSGQQLDKILATLINLRPTLANVSGLLVTWLDFAYAGTQSGTYAEPYSTLANATTAVATGGTIVIKSSSSPVHPTLVKAMTIDSFRGPSLLGN